MADLKVTLVEDLTLYGSQRGASNVMTISGINEAFKRIITVKHTGSGETLLSCAEEIQGGSQFDRDHLLYIRITNLDNTNHVVLTFKDENNSEFAVKLDKGQSFIYNGDLADGVVNTMDASATSLSLELADLVDITAKADTASCDLEIFAASK